LGGKYLSEESRRESRRRKQNRRLAVSVVIRWLLILALAAVILFNVFTHLVQVVHYNGKGMEPTLKSGQILVFRKTQEVQPGDIIAFYYNNQVLVRRVIALENSQIVIEADGSVQVNGKTLEEPYLESASMGQCNLKFPYRVPQDALFVMGDSRTVSMDSRLKEIGPVSTDRIIGKLLFAL